MPSLSLYSIFRHDLPALSLKASLLLSLGLELSINLLLDSGGDEWGDLDDDLVGQGRIVEGGVGVLGQGVLHSAKDHGPQLDCNSRQNN